MIWLLLLISFGVTGCLVLTLVVFDLLDPDRKANKATDDEVVSTIVVIPSSPTDAITQDKVVQTRSRASSEPASMEVRL